MKRPSKKEIIVTFILFAGFAGYLMIPHILFLHFHRVASLPKDTWIENYYSNGPSIDTYYVWKLESDSSTSIKTFLDSINFKEVKARNTANCLSLSSFNDNLPQWLRVADLDEALWDFTEKPYPYELFRKKLPYGASCIFLRNEHKVAYVIWFDPS